MVGLYTRSPYYVLRGRLDHPLAPKKRRAGPIRPGPPAKGCPYRGVLSAGKTRTLGEALRHRTGSERGPGARRCWNGAPGRTRQAGGARGRPYARPTGGSHGRTPADPAQRSRGKGRVKARLRRARSDGKGAAPKRSRWDGSEKAGIGDASQVGECPPHRGGSWSHRWRSSATRRPRPRELRKAGRGLALVMRRAGARNTRGRAQGGSQNARPWGQYRDRGRAANRLDRYSRRCSLSVSL
jgi:hypothetical protein